MNKKLTTFNLESGARRVEGDFAVYPNSLLFRAGDYPDKKFTLSPAEMTAAASVVLGVKGNIQHSKYLHGRACEVRKAWTEQDGQVLRGEVAVPLGLDNLLTDEERKVSCEWNRDTKTLEGLALCLNPRVSDAALMSLDASFASRHDTARGQQAMQDIHDTACRNGAVCDPDNAKKPVQMASQHESDAIQAAHDMAVEHGAKCEKMKRGQTVNPYSYYSKDKTEMARFDRAGKGSPMYKKLLALLLGKGVLDEDEAARFAAEAEKEAETDKTVVASFADSPEYKAMQANMEQMARSIIQKDAEAFAASMEDRIVPAERPALIAAFVRAAEDDAKNPATVTFDTVNEKGEKAAFSGTRLDALRAQYASRPKHRLTESVLPTGGEYAALFNKTVTPGNKEQVHKDGYEEGKAFAKSLNGKGN